MNNYVEELKKELDSFTTISNHSKRGKDFIERYNLSNARELWDVYSSFSREKEKAFRECETKCYMHFEGEFLKIISSNIFGFTVGYLVDLDNIRYLIIETPKNTYKILY